MSTDQVALQGATRHHNTKRNFKIFKAPDFIAAALLHLPPKGQQTVRYYGVYSNKARGRPRETATIILNTCRNPPNASSENQTSTLSNYQSELLLVEPPPKRSARRMRPLWRDLILQVWGGILSNIPAATAR